MLALLLSLSCGCATLAGLGSSYPQDEIDRFHAKVKKLHSDLDGTGGGLGKIRDRLRRVSQGDRGDLSQVKQDIKNLRKLLKVLQSLPRRTAAMLRSGKTMITNAPRHYMGKRAMHLPKKASLLKEATNWLREMPDQSQEIISEAQQLTNCARDLVKGKGRRARCELSEPSDRTEVAEQDVEMEDVEVKPRRRRARASAPPASRESSSSRKSASRESSSSRKSQSRTSRTSASRESASRKSSSRQQAQNTTQQAEPGKNAVMFDLNGLLARPSSLDGFGLGYRHVYSDHLHIRLALGLDNLSFEIDADGQGKSTDEASDFALGVGLDYILRRNENLVLYVGGLAQSSLSSEDPEGNNNSTDGTSFTLAAVTGVNWFFTQHLSLSAEYRLGLVQTVVDADGDVDTETSVLQVGSGSAAFMLGFWF